MQFSLRNPFATVTLCAMLTGCAVGPLGGPPVPPGEPANHKAFFSAFPAELFEAVATGCSDEADTLTQFSDKSLRCETLPAPETAATLILQFDGDIERLPTQVNTLQAAQSGDGFVVQADYFFNIPRLNDSTIEVRIPQARADRAIWRAFRALGGAEIHSEGSPVP